MTTVLENSISQVRAKIHRARMSQLLSDRVSLIGVDGVRSQLVTPILAALGWNPEDDDEVRLGIPLDRLDEGSCIGLFLSGAPCWLIAVRGMGQTYDQNHVMCDVLPVAGDAGFEWVLLTDGDDYDVFNAHTGLPNKQRPFDAIRISADSAAGALELLDLFSRKRMEENCIKAAWKCRVIDRQVKELFEDVIASGDALVQLLLTRTEHLSAGEIRRSLTRAELILKFESHGRSDSGPEGEAMLKGARAAGMSAAELEVATWLQHRSIERWAKGGATPLARSRASQRRGQDPRRSSPDRRSSCEDRRIVRVEKATERREHGDRRSDERRRDLERRVMNDRRRLRRRA
jgi:predicted type IV restriction endonuclease